MLLSPQRMEAPRSRWALAKENQLELPGHLDLVVEDTLEDGAASLEAELQ